MVFPGVFSASSWWRKRSTSLVRERRFTGRIEPYNWDHGSQSFPWVYVYGNEWSRPEYSGTVGKPRVHSQGYVGLKLRGGRGEGMYMSSVPQWTENSSPLSFPTVPSLSRTCLEQSRLVDSVGRVSTENTNGIRWLVWEVRLEWSVRVLVILLTTSDFRGVLCTLSLPTV